MESEHSKTLDSSTQSNQTHLCPIHEYAPNSPLQYQVFGTRKAGRRPRRISMTISNVYAMVLQEPDKHFSSNIPGPAEIHEGKKPIFCVDQVGSEQCSLVDPAANDGVEVTCFTEDLHDVTLHFQIIRMMKQIYVWIGCNSVKFGHLYAAATTRPSNMVSVTSLLGGSADNAGSSIARHLVLKTGLNVILACNIPKNSPMLEAEAERKLVQKLRDLGYIGPTSHHSSSHTSAYLQ